MFRAACALPVSRIRTAPGQPPPWLARWVSRGSDGKAKCLWVESDMDVPWEPRAAGLRGGDPGSGRRVGSGPPSALSRCGWSHLRSFPRTKLRSVQLRGRRGPGTRGRTGRRLHSTRRQAVWGWSYRSFCIDFFCVFFKFLAFPFGIDVQSIRMGAPRRNPVLRRPPPWSFWAALGWGGG